MSKNIQSGVVLDSLKSLPSMMNQFFEKVFKDFEVKDSKVSKSGKGAIFEVLTGGDHTVKVKVEPTSTSNVYDVYLVGDNGSKKKVDSVRSKKVDDTIKQFIDSEYEESIEEYDDLSDDEFKFSSDIKSKKLSMIVSKDQQNEETKLHTILSNYDPLSTYSDVSIILEDPEFNDSLTEEPQGFCIYQDEDSFDVQPEEIDQISTIDATQKSIKDVLMCSLIYKLRCSLFRLPHQNYDCRDYTVESIIDFFRKNQEKFDINLFKVYQHILSSELSYLESYDSILLEEEALLENIANVLDMNKNNFDDEVTHLIEDWVLSLRYIRN